MISEAIVEASADILIISKHVYLLRLSNKNALVY